MPQPAPVGVLGGHEVGPVVEDPRSIPEMVLEAVLGALDDAGCGWDDLDATVTASADLYDGLTASNIAVTEVVGGVMAPETRIAADGLAAAIHAVHQIRSGAYRRVLVVAHCKPSMAPHRDLTPWAMDPILLQPLGVDFAIVSGLQADLVAGDDPEAAMRRWAGVAARRFATAGVRRSPAAILEAEPLAKPITAAIGAPLADGACAVILDGAADNATPVITGVGHDLAAHHPDRSLVRWDGLARACERAYRQAGVDDPATAIALVAPSCRFPHEENLFVAATGVGPGTSLVPGGGLFAGAMPLVAGLSRLLAAARAVGGRANTRALAHGTWGPAGQGQAVAVVEGR